MENVVETVDRQEIEKQGHIDALITIRNKPAKHPKQQEWNNERERYHMAALHNRWFSKSRKEKQV